VMFLEGETRLAENFDRRRPNKRLKLTARSTTLVCERSGRRSLGALR